MFNMMHGSNKKRPNHSVIFFVRCYNVIFNKFKELFNSTKTKHQHTILICRLVKLKVKVDKKTIRETKGIGYCSIV